MIKVPSQHYGCTMNGTLRYATNVTAEEEFKANEHEDAAVLVCDACKERVVDDSTSSRPDRFRKQRVPDQSVFEVAKR